MRIIVLLSLFLSFSVLAGTGAIPSGPNIKLLKDNLRFKNTDTKIMTNDSDDPTSVAKDAEIGSLYIQAGTGALFQKQDSGSSTNWLSLLIGPVGNGTDNHLTRWDGTGTPNLQDSLAILDDLGALSGLTQLDVDNIRVDGNTISSTDTNGHLLLDANGTGNISIPNDSLVINSSIDNNAGAVNGTAVTGGVVSHVDNNSARAELALSRHENTTAGIGATMYGARTRGTEIAATAVQSGDDLLNIYALGHDGTDWAMAARVQFEADGVTGNDDMPGRIVFRTSPDGTQTPAEAMRIDSSQNVTFSGNIVTPLTTNSVPYIGATGELVEDNPGFTYDGNTLTLTNNSASTLVDLTQAGSGTTFNINNSGSGDFITVNGTDMILDNAGNLGLGIVPNDTLDVVGTAQIDDLRFDTGTISTATGDLTISPATELTSIDTNIVYNPTGLGDGMSVYANTSDTADNSFYLISGGGDVDPTRGSYIGVYGNENSIYGGDINFSIGDNPASTFSFRCDGGITNCLEGDVNGKWTIGESGGTQTHQVEGDLAITGLTQNGVPYVGASDVLATDVLNFGYLAGTQNFYVNGITDLDNIQIDGNTIASSDANGNIVLNPNGTGNVNLPDLTISQPAYIDASGNLVSQDLSLTADVSGILPIANGGTNSSTALNNNRLMISSTGSIVEHSALTQGSVLFADANGLPAEDNTNFTWDNTAKTLGIIGDVTVDNVQLNGNLLTAVGTNQDLQLHATGTGAITMSQNPLEFTELTATPTSGPAAGLNQLYFQNDQKLRALDASGHVETLSTNESRPHRQYNRVADAAAAVIGDFSTGQNATFDGGGSITAGALTIETGSLDTQDSKYYQYTHGTLNDYFYFTVPTDEATDIGYRFRYSYDGDDDDMELEVKCTTSGFIYPPTPIKATGGAVESFFDMIYVPSGCGDLKIGFSVAVANATKNLNFNRFVVTDDPTVYGKQIEEQVFVFSATASTMTATSGTLRWGSVPTIKDESNALTYDDSTGKWTANKDCQIEATLSSRSATASNQTTMVVNATTVTRSDNGGANLYIQLAKTYYLSAGDTFHFTSVNALDGAYVPYLAITAKSESDAYNVPAKSGTEKYKANYQSNFWDATGSISTFDISLIPLTNSRFLEWNDTTETRLVAKQDVIVNITALSIAAAAGVSLYLYDSSANIIDFNIGAAANYPMVVSNEIKLLKGDYIYFTSTNAGTRSGAMSITARPVEVTFTAQVPVPQVAHIGVNATATTWYGSVAATTAYKTVTLFNVEGDSEIVSISSNRIKLNPGKYLIEFPAGAYSGAQNLYQQFYNVTDAAVIKELVGTSYSTSTSPLYYTTVKQIINTNKTIEVELQTKSAIASGSEYWGRITVTKYKTNRN